MQIRQEWLIYFYELTFRNCEYINIINWLGIQNINYYYISIIWYKLIFIKNKILLFNLYNDEQ